VFAAGPSPRAVMERGLERGCLGACVIMLVLLVLCLVSASLGYWTYLMVGTCSAFGALTYYVLEPTLK
jgi:hypothetical protein